MSIGLEKWYMKMALEASLQSRDPSTKIGAVIAKGEDFISYGFNRFPKGVREYALERCPECEGRWKSCFKCNYTKHRGYLALKEELDPERWKRPEKYLWISHAERNAIYAAAQAGKSTKGCTLYVTCKIGDICNDCAKAIIESGLQCVVGLSRELKLAGKETGHLVSGDIVKIMFEEAGIETRETDEEI